MRGLLASHRSPRESTYALAILLRSSRFVGGGALFPEYRTFDFLLTRIGEDNGAHVF